MPILDQEEIFGKLIPTVYIDRVTLETTAQTPAKIDNPHIDTGATGQIVEDKFKDKSSTDPSFLKVSLDLSIKEVLDGDFVGRWFDDEKIRKYIKIRVIQSTDPVLSKALSSSNSAISITQQTAFENLQSPTFQTLLSGWGFLSAGGGVSNLESFIEKLNSSFDEKKLTLDYDVTGDREALASKYSQKDENGNSIIDITFKATFDIEAENPSHLSYFVVSYLDMELLREDFNLSFNSFTSKEQNGEVRSETIIDAAELVSWSLVYVDPEGKIWSGAVHQRSPGVWASYSTETKNSVALTIKRVVNSKVQDFRNIENVEKLQIDLAAIGDEVQPLQNKLLALKRDNMVREKSNAYFSNICLSRSRAGAAKLFFALDYQKLLKDTSVYKKIYELSTPKEVERMLRFGRVKYMKLLRRRISPVTTDNILGNPVEGKVVFDTDNPPSIIATGSDGGRVFTASNDDTGGLRELVVTLEMGQNGVRFFTAEDRSMIDVTDGVYQYGVEIEVEDAAARYLNNLARNLTSTMKELKQYYEEGTKLGMTRAVVELSDPHIDSAWERLSILNKTPGNYEPTSNRFTETFIKEQRKKWENSKNNSPWVKALTEYFRTLSILTPLSEVYDIQKISTELFKLAAPETGNPQSVSAIIELMEQLISRIGSLTGGTGSGDHSDANVQSYSQINKKVENKTNKIEYWFAEESFDSDVQKNYGYEYLSEAEGEKFDKLIEDAKQIKTPGLRLVPGEEYDNRLQAETLKYYNSLDPDLNMKKGGVDITSGDTIENSYFGFISPSFCYLGQEVKTMLDVSGTTQQTQGNDYYSVLESILLNFNTKSAPIPKQRQNSKRRAISATAQEYKNNIQSFFSNLGMSVESVETPSLIPGVEKLVSPQPSSFLETKEKLQSTFLKDDSKIEPLGDELPFKSEVEDEQEDINPNSLFLGIIKTFIDDGSLNINGPVGSTSAVIPFKKKNMASPDSVDPETIDTYNLNSDINIVNRISQYEEAKVDLAKSTGVEDADKKTVSDIIKSLPNQIKSVILSSVNSGPVRNNLFEKEYDAVIDVESSSYFRINYSFINKIEVATGYPNKSSMKVKELMWKPLTLERYKSAAGKQLLCRMSEFSAPTLGIKHPKGLKLELFDKYFILQPATLFDPVEGEAVTTLEQPTVEDPGQELIIPEIDGIIETTPKLGQLQNNPVGPKPDDKFCLPFRK